VRHRSIITQDAVNDYFHEPKVIGRALSIWTEASSVLDLRPGWWVRAGVHVHVHVWVAGWVVR